MRNLKELNEDLQEAVRKLRLSNRNLCQLRDELIGSPQKEVSDGETKEPTNLIESLVNSLIELQEEITDNKDLSTGLLNVIGENEPYQTTEPVSKGY